MPERSSEQSIIESLQPAGVEEVILHPMVGRAIAVVRYDQLVLAIGDRGARVRAASDSTGWDVEIMTPDEFQGLRRDAIAAFSDLDGSSREVAEKLVKQGYLTYSDLATAEPDVLVELTQVSSRDAAAIVAHAQSRMED